MGYKSVEKRRKMEPFVKWAGGKRQLLERLNARLPENFNTYYEPFVGAGALWLDLKPRRAVVNDNNSQLMNCYYAIKKNPREMLRKIQELDNAVCNQEFYLQIREQYNSKIIKDELDVEMAALMIWINKHCFNGLYRTNKQGLFNVPYNNKFTGKSIDEMNVGMISYYLNDADVEMLCVDFEEACRDCQAGDFIFFDSPYVPISKTAGFVDYTKESFKKEDHERLARLFRELDARGCYCMLTNHNVEWVYELYAGYNIEEVDVKRAINSNASKRTGKEVIITNYA